MFGEERAVQCLLFVCDRINSVTIHYKGLLIAGNKDLSYNKIRIIIK